MSLVMPITILIIVAIIGITVGFYHDFEGQIEAHKEELTEIYEQREVTVLRLYGDIKNY